ncbi:g7619 [Coccomyxa viridis]|uniref:G7619 protein n=1 Tax=Coccomyxa viridis TaxID=1274662 RepID=A0ABP1FZE9_9CHLO
MCLGVLYDFLKGFCAGRATRYRRKVFEEYQRRWNAVVGKPWNQGMMPEYFLGRVNSSHKQRGDKVRDSVVDQVAQWLAYSPEQKRQYMDAHTKGVQLTDMRHPAFRRFKEVIEPWGLRKKEHALHFRKGGQHLISLVWLEEM